MLVVRREPSPPAANLEDDRCVRAGHRRRGTLERAIALPHRSEDLSRGDDPEMLPADREIERQGERRGSVLMWSWDPGYTEDCPAAWHRRSLPSPAGRAPA